MSPHTSSAPVPSKEYDVLVVGAGPAGMMASTCLTTYGLSVLHIDNRPTTTAAGRADGLQPRTLEVLRNIGSVKVEEGKSSLAKRMVSQGVRVYSVAFWDPTETEQLARTSRAPSCPDFIDVVDNYTLLLHQGLIENAFVDEIQQRRQLLSAEKLKPAPHGGVFRPYTFISCETDPASNPEHPVKAVIQNSETLVHHELRAKYLLGCDGAKSQVKRCISAPSDTPGGDPKKIVMLGDVSDIVFAVVDVEVSTDFPDILSKCMIHSKDAGSIMVIPREDNLVRLYVQLQKGEGEAGQNHIERDKATLDICFERAKKIFEPFTLEFGRVAWFSVYQIGQRIANHYTLDNRIFLAGDAVHTHSPKAGQGMNISLLDAYSWSWRINLVEKGMADPAILLPTYEQERKSVAEELLRFDSEYTKLFAGRAPPQSTVDLEIEAKSKAVGTVDPVLFIETFKRNAFFTSGCGAIYFAGPLSALPDSELVKNYPKQGVFNPPGTHLIAGQRLLPGKITRAVDANQVRIQQEIRMDGSFRIHVFAGRFKSSLPRLEAFSSFLASSSSFHNVHRPSSSTPLASVLPTQTPSSRHISHEQPPLASNPFFTYLTVFATPYTEWDVDQVPAALRQVRDYVYSDDIFDRRVAEAGVDAPMHRKYGVDVEKGSIIVVRPDGYVGAVVELSEDGHEALNAYFAGFLKGRQ